MAPVLTIYKSIGVMIKSREHLAHTFGRNLGKRRMFEKLLLTNTTILVKIGRRHGMIPIRRSQFLGSDKAIFILIQSSKKLSTARRIQS